MDMVVDSHVAASIAAIKDHVSQKIFLKIKGTVTARSNIFKIKKDKVFLIELDNCIVLLVKDYHLDWWPLINIDHTYLFTNIRLTLIDKGIIKPCKVFFVWKSSSLLEVDNEDLPLIDLQTWLHAQGLRKVTIDEENILEESHKRNNTHLFNYEGVITCCDKASVGLYTLDDKVGLFVGLAEYYKPKLKLQSKVYVHNAHMTKVDNEVTLVCCVKTSVITEKSEEVQTCEPAVDGEGLDYAVFQLGLNCIELERMLTIYQSMIYKFKSSKRNSSIIASTVAQNSFWNKTEEKIKTNAVDRFIFHEYCPLLKFSLSRCLVPEMLHLQSLRYEEAILSSLPNSPYFSKDNLKCWWFDQSESKILIGKIQPSPSGHLILNDGSHQLPVLLLHSSLSDMSSPSQTHVCSAPCRKPLSRFTNIICPFITSRSLRKLICIHQFCLISEGLGDSDAKKTSSASHGGETLIYLAFCLRDCFMFEESTVENEPLEGGLGSTKPNETSSNGVNVTSMIVYIMEKHALMSSLETTFDVVGYKFSSLDAFYQDFVENILPVSEDTDCDSSTVDGNDSTDSDGPLEQLIMEIERQETDVASKKTSVTAYHEQFRDIGKLKSVHITFTGGTLYSLIFPGHLYKLTVRIDPGGTNPFEDKFSEKRLKRAANHSNLKQHIKAPPSVTLHELSLDIECTSQTASLEQLNSLNEVLSDSFSGSIASFKAVISSFEFEKSSLSGQKGIFCKKINVTEYSHQASHVDFTMASIYLGPEHSSYNFGLITGAVVNFHRLHRKRSRLGNVYFRFIPTSSATVISISSNFKSKVSAVHSSATSISDAPMEMLRNLWLSGPGISQQLYKIECYICVIFRLSIKATCSKCASVLLKKRCRECGYSEFSSVKAHAVILVDDGTSQASAKVSEAELVRKLLTLTEVEWEDLVETAKDVGEIIVSKVAGNTAHNDAINWFLCNLTNSPVVLRPCRIVVSVSRNSPWEKTLEASQVKDLQMREERIGNNELLTLSLPLLQVECLDIQNLY